MKTKNCIVIPVYDEKPTKCDKLSIWSLSNIKDIADWDIFIICPEYFNYKSVINNNWLPLFKQNANILYMDNKYFVSEKAYSDLLRNYVDFWQKFSDYEYMLIFQLDGYCINCTLSDWTSKGYDFIGAPIISENANWMNVPAIGNGGVSLRKVKTFLDITNPDGECLKTIKDDIDKFNKARSNIYDFYEDLYFCELVNKYWDLDIARQDDAFDFAWDMNVDVVYEIRKHKLPCFLHAWTKNIRFWQNQLSVFEDFDIINECEKKYAQSYLGKNGLYQANLPHKDAVSVGIICCVRNENWHIVDKCNQWLDQGFDKIILIDNNNVDDEPVKKYVNNINKVEVIENKYVGKQSSDDYDLISEMYSDAYNNYTDGLDYVIFLDADEELHFTEQTDSVFKLAKFLRDETKYYLMDIPVTIIDVNNNKSEYLTNKFKPLIKTGLNLTKFTRFHPICNYSSSIISATRVSIYNHTTYNSYEEYEKYKLNRGYPDTPLVDGAKLTDENYFYKVNPDNINKSTIKVN